MSLRILSLETNSYSSRSIELIFLLLITKDSQKCLCLKNDRRFLLTQGRYLRLRLEFAFKQRKNRFKWPFGRLIDTENSHFTGDIYIKCSFLFLYSVEIVVS